MAATADAAAPEPAPSTAASRFPALHSTIMDLEGAAHVSELTGCCVCRRLPREQVVWVLMLQVVGTTLLLVRGGWSPTAAAVACHHLGALRLFQPPSHLPSFRFTASRTQVSLQCTRGAQTILGNADEENASEYLSLTRLSRRLGPGLWRTGLRPPSPPLGCKSLLAIHEADTLCYARHQLLLHALKVVLLQRIQARQRQELCSGWWPRRRCGRLAAQRRLIQRLRSNGRQCRLIQRQLEPLPSVNRKRVTQPHLQCPRAPAAAGWQRRAGP